MTEYLDISITKDQLYTALKKIHQLEFPDDFKLIAVYNNDVINNTEYPGTYLSNFVEILASLDFPTFFVKISTTHPNITRDLKFLNSLHKNGIIESVNSATSFVSRLESRNTFCVLPWMHFYFNPQGQIHPCCNSNINHPLGDFKQNQIDFNSEEIVKFRQLLIDNQVAPQCSICYVREDAGISSFRQQQNQRFAKFIPVKPEAIVPDFKLRYLDIRLSNLCNLQCRMCSGKFSSKIASEDFKLWGSTEFLYNSNSKNYEDKILNLIKDNINSIEFIYFAGGEPLINDFHYKVLDLLLEYNKTHIDITYNTNFSIIDRSLEYWPKFSKVTVCASIDLHGKAADYVRHGVEYSTLELNYIKLTESCPNVNFKITSILSLYNIFNLCTLQKEWLKTVNNKNISFSILSDPSNMSIRVLPAEYKRKANNIINDHIKLLKQYDAQNLIGSWENALEFMNSKDDGYLLKSFFDIGDIRDKNRNQILEDYLPEFQELRKYAT